MIGHRPHDPPSALDAGDLLVAGVRVRLRGPSSLLTRLAAALATEAAPPAGPAAVEYAVAADGAGDGWVVRQDGAAVYEGDADAVVGWLEWSAVNQAVERLDGWWRVHAGAVVHGGQAIVLPADTRTGKSTLVAALVRAGHAFLSDELALLDRQARVHPFVKAICLRAGAWPLLDPPISAPTASRFGEPVHYLDPRPLVARSAAGYPIKAIVQLTRDEAGGPAIVPMRRSEALLLLLRQTSASQQMGFDLVQRAVALVKAAPAYQLRLGPDLAACVRLIDEVGSRQ